MCMGGGNTGVQAAPNPIAARMAESPTAVSSTAYTDDRPLKVRPSKDQSYDQARKAAELRRLKSDVGALRSRAATADKALKINQGAGSGLNT